jgi:3-phenylpropionate/trans-cinnamate dioxygenase ferredoxin component
MQSENESLACLCEENEIEEGRSKKFVVNGREILLLKTNGSLQAIESFCPHAFADFSLGKINARAGTIKCTNHGAVFDLKNGKALCGPFGVDGEILPSLTFFNIRIIKGKVFLICEAP